MPDQAGYPPNGSGVVRYTYDARDRMVDKSMPAGKLSYTYDAGGHVASMKSSNAGGVDIAYGWDGAGRLVSVGDPAGVSTFEYDAAGRMTKRTDPNGIVMTYAYDSANRVLDVNAKRGVTAIADYAYERDVIGRVTKLTELSGRVVTYGYSAAGRLVNETVVGEPHGINGAISYTHDAVGNRLTRSSTLGPIVGQAFVYDGNDRIAAEMYDANGNVLASDGDVIGFDFEDRLTVINGGVAISYDASGNIGSRTEGGTKVSYLVDEISPTGYTQVVEEVTSSGVAKTYAYGQSPLRSGTSSYVQDGHTDVRMLADASGAVSDQYDYEAFGVGTRTVGTTANVLRYTGERSESAGLTFLRARHMRNGSGRFTGMDPWEGDLDSPGTLHRSFYANGNPTLYFDPTGRQFDLKSFMAGTAGMSLMAVQNLKGSFSQGGAAVGRAIQAFGQIGESGVRIILTEMKAVNPTLIWTAGLKVASAGQSGATRVIDFFVKLGPRTLLMEVKYRIPPSSAEGFARMTDQLKSAVASGQAQEVWLVLVREPTAAQRAQVLGTGVHQILTMETVADRLMMYFQAFF